jgi:hypothetical protein
MLLDTGKCCDAFPVGKVAEDEEVLCGVCKSVCEEKRGLENPVADILNSIFGNVVQATAKADAFRCPNRNEPWHVQMNGILVLANDSPSKKLQDILVEEANEIFRTKKCTLEKFEESKHCDGSES